MRLPWNKSKEVQLDLLVADSGTTAPHQPEDVTTRAVVSSCEGVAISRAAAGPTGNDGRPLLVAVSMLYEDAHNPRTEFPEESIAELAEDIRQRGVLQPLVVHPVDGDGRQVLAHAVADHHCVVDRMAHQRQLATLAMLVDIWVRCEWPFAVGAILTLALDVVLTLGVFALTGLDFSLTAIAALRLGGARCFAAGRGCVTSGAWTSDCDATCGTAMPPAGTAPSVCGSTTAAEASATLSSAATAGSSRRSAREAAEFPA